MKKIDFLIKCLILDGYKTDDISPNLVARYAYDLSIELTSRQIVDISNNYNNNVIFLKRGDK